MTPLRDVVALVVPSASREGVAYSIRDTDGTVSCGCPGFQFRRKCRHVTEYERSKSVNEQQERAAPSKPANGNHVEHVVGGENDAPPDCSAITGQLFAALAKAQGQFCAVAKGKTARVKMRDSGEYTYSYADLADVIAAVQKPLAANGLAFVQRSRRGELVTTLGHTSGQWIEGSVPIVGAGSTPQQYGSALTYARRYGLCSLLGIQPEEEDDDGAAAQRAPAKPAAKREQQKKAPPKEPAPSQPLGEEQLTLEVERCADPRRWWDGRLEHIRRLGAAGMERIRTACHEREHVLQGPPDDEDAVDVFGPPGGGQ